jgi:hypothetical protein
MQHQVKGLTQDLTWSLVASGADISVARPMFSVRRTCGAITLPSGARKNIHDKGIDA